MKNLSLCILEQQYSTILKDGEDKCWKCLLHAANIFFKSCNLWGAKWIMMPNGTGAHVEKCKSLWVNECITMTQWKREKEYRCWWQHFFSFVNLGCPCTSTSQPQATFHDVHSETFKLIWRFYLKKEPQWSQELIATKPLLKAQSVINCRKDPTEAVKKPPTLLREAKQQIWKLKASY